jgi:hypothetical protein
VGLHTSGPATNGTSTVAVPVPIALILAVKLVPLALLDPRASTRLFEMVGGPGQVPPAPSNPPESTRVEPAVTHTVVTLSHGCHITLTVPLVHGALVGVVVTSAWFNVVVDAPGGSVGLAVVDDVEHPAMNRPATTVRAIRHIATPTSY